MRAEELYSKYNDYLSGLSFHRSFPLRRAAISEILRLCHQQSEKGKSLNCKTIYRLTNLGTIQAQAYPRYAYRAGLISSDGLLTVFGKATSSYDMFLSTLSTHWLMHYHLSALQGTGPWFWHYLVTRVLKPGHEISGHHLAQELAHALREHGGSRLRERTIRTTATVFIGSYAKPEGLSALRLLQQVGKDRYVVRQPEPVPLWVFAYALVDTWMQVWQERVTMNLASLFEPGGLSSIFFLDESSVDQLVASLAREGLIDLYRVVPPYQLVRRWEGDPRGQILERVYENA
jgi:hypothetical protein